MNTGYIMRRLARRWFPGILSWRRVHLLRLPVQCGLETLKPQLAVDRYLAALAECAFSIQGKRIFILGYGGVFAVGCKLLAAGARHVILCDPYTKPDHGRNRLLLTEYGNYLRWQNGQVLPRTEYLSVYTKDVCQLVKEHSIEPVDLASSASVLEHVEDVEGTVGALSGLTHPDGLALHFIDICDHLYRYPFEMLSYSPFIWQYWLNPSSHLNRYRLWDYRQIFSHYYSQVTIAVEKKDEHSFARTAHKIRPEFKTGNLHEDSATFIRVTARSPLAKTL